MQRMPMVWLEKCMPYNQGNNLGGGLRWNVLVRNGRGLTLRA
jgi:hypothetical protein